MKLDDWEQFFWELSPTQLSRMKRFHLPADQIRNLVGILLMRRLFQQIGLNPDASKQLKKNRYGKPYLEMPIYFNISHSQNLIAGAVSRDSVVGIDVEWVRKIDFAHYKKVMTPGQWKEIRSSLNPIAAFFSTWTRKEAAIKADGRGMNWPLEKVEIVNMKATNEQDTFYLKDLAVGNEYKACLATSVPEFYLDWERLYF